MVEKERAALGKVYAEDYNFSFATTTPGARGSKNAIRSCLSESVPYHVNANQIPGSKLTLNVKNKKKVMYLSGTHKQKVSQGHIPITDKNLNSTETIYVDKRNKPP